jgi:hypothetical protein
MIGIHVCFFVPKLRVVFPLLHSKLPMPKYSPRIARADAMVIDFGVKNRVVALWISRCGIVDIAF